MLTRQLVRQPRESASARAACTAVAETSYAWTVSPRCASHTAAVPRPHARSSAVPERGNRSAKGRNAAGNPTSSACTGGSD